MLLLALGCQDQGFHEIQIDALAVVQGDFDNMGDVLVGMNIATQEYDGFIVQATYEPDDERTERGYGAPTVEGLLTSTDDDGRLQIELFNAVFINSGTRGLGAFQYNNTLLEDDSLLLDTAALDNACSFVSGGGSLVVTDWAYEVVEYCWPDAVEFFGDDTVADAAQVGMPDEISADVLSKDLKDALGPAIGVTFDYSAWSVIESVGGDTEVLLDGGISYQPSAEELPVDAPDTPLMVRFTEGRGQVIYSSFHLAAQGNAIADALLLGSVEGLERGDGEETTTTDTGGDGA
jgi:hypothetical protein